MVDDDLVIGQKRRSGDPAVALAEEAVRMQRDTLAELRRQAAARIAEDAAARQAANKQADDKKTPLPGEPKASQDATASGTEKKGDAPPPDDPARRNPDTKARIDVEA